MGKIAIITSLAALVGIALSQPNFEVKYNDSGFKYYSQYDINDIADDELERTAYVRLGLDANGLVVTLSDEPFEGAIEQTFTEIPELNEETYEQIWGEVQAGESFLVKQNLQEFESERVHRLVGLSDQGLGWAIVHADAELGDVVNTYLAWLSEAGVSVTTLGAGVNEQSYELSTQGQTVRAVFARVGDNVRAYFQ